MAGSARGSVFAEAVLGGIYPYPARSIVFVVLLAAILIARTMLPSRGGTRLRSIGETLTGNLTLVLGIIAAVGFALRIMAFLRGGLDWSTEGVDSIGYVRLADGIRAGCGFATRVGGACGPPDIVRTPGYPAFLALLPNFPSAVVLQSLIAVAASFAVGIAVGTVFGAPAGIAAAALLCFEPYSVKSGAKIMSDCLFQALLAFAVLLELYVIAKDRVNWRAVGITLVAGVLLAGALFIRPIGLVLVILVPIPFLAMTNLAWRRRILLAACMVLTPVVVIAGWIERNQQCCGYPTFSAIQVADLYYYKAAGVLSFESGMGLVAAKQQLAHEAGIPLDRILDADPGMASPMTRQFGETLRQRAMSIIGRDPQALVAVTAIRFAFIAFWVSDNNLSDIFGRPPRKAYGIWPKLSQGCFVLAQLAISAFIWIGFVSAVVQSFRQPLRQRVLILFPAVLGLMLLAAAAGPEADGRLRLAAIPYLAAVGSIGWLGRIRNEDKNGDAVVVKPVL